MDNLQEVPGYYHNTTVCQPLEGEVEAFLPEETVPTVQILVFILPLSLRHDSLKLWQSEPIPSMTHDIPSMTHNICSLNQTQHSLQLISY